MSYLDPTRLHFAGQFQANVSTVNNDPTHFDNATFTPQDQEYGNGATNGWWNPQGSGDWRLLGCEVTSAYNEGAPAESSDPVLACAIADSDDAVPAKLVDLDPQQQLVSMVWGLTVRIVDSDGNDLMTGDFVPAAFTNLWGRAVNSAGGDMNMGACWQSVLENVVWGDVSGSPTLQALKDKTTGNKLSIKFNVDGYNMVYSNADFTCGRMVGTIGPYLEGEPDHMLIARQLIADPNYLPIVPRRGAAPPYLYNAQIIVDPATSMLLCDFGNTIPTENSGGDFANIGDINIGCFTGSFSQDSFEPIVGISPSFYTAAKWYESTAGIIALPITADQLGMVEGQPLAVTASSASNPNASQPIFAVHESPDGRYVRADSFVVRMSPGDSPSITVYAMQFGAPLGGALIEFPIDNNGLQGAPSGNLQVGVPPEFLPAPNGATTGDDGSCIMSIQGGNPGTPRWTSSTDYGLDGQLYGIRPVFSGVSPDDPSLNSWDFVSVHLYSGYAAPNDPATWADIQPIMQQYANLYPVMARFLDLADEDSVKGNLWLLKLAFQLPMSDPNHMPVTRDLSDAKRKAIVSYLENVGSESAAAEARPRPPVKASPVTKQQAVAAAKAAADGSVSIGSKTLAMTNRANTQGDAQ